ncbi:protein of unknown function [Pararobbsia alpina]|uniref:GAF domain-containing sensor histidine kinase n=1 Tax=Pararobbsia alpina TaxID=621374 RepID=UPI0039A41E7D
MRPLPIQYAALDRRESAFSAALGVEWADMAAGWPFPPNEAGHGDSHGTSHDDSTRDHPASAISQPSTGTEASAAAVLRASSVLSNTLPQCLVETLLSMALDSVGAECGALVVLNQDRWVVQALAQRCDSDLTIDRECIPMSASSVPVSLVFTVAQTHQVTFIGEESTALAYANDVYVRGRRPRSMLCVPLIRYATVAGALYLETSREPMAFSPAKVPLLEFIAAQAAMALESGRLHDQLIQEHRQRSSAEEQLRTALSELARATRLKAMGELVASIVHEVGQPLASINASASAAMRWLERDPPVMDEVHAMVGHISLSAQRAKAIVEALRAKARQAAPRFGTMELGSAVSEAAALIAVQLDDLHARLVIKGFAAPVHVHGDRIQLQQVLINLLVNGAESMAERAKGERLLWLTCSTDQPGEVSVVVEDVGCGIDPAVSSRLFEPLFTTKENGMGMGLAISQSIVESHGGTLCLGAREVAGTRATLTLPRLVSLDSKGTDIVAPRIEASTVETSPVETLPVGTRVSSHLEADMSASEGERANLSVESAQASVQIPAHVPGRAGAQG